MSDNTLTNVIARVLERYAVGIAMDLAQCEDQKEMTTKHYRRERALAYLTDVTCFCSPGRTASRISRGQVEDLLYIVRSVLPNARQDEARIGFQRVEKRLMWLLDHPDEMAGHETCAACGEVYAGQNHKCTNQRARMKDVAMAHDNTLGSDLT